MFHRTVIVTMDGQTSGVSTGTDQSVELEIKSCDTGLHKSTDKVIIGIRV